MDIYADVSREASPCNQGSSVSQKRSFGKIISKTWFEKWEWLLYDEPAQMRLLFVTFARRRRYFSRRGFPGIPLS